MSRLQHKKGRKSNYVKSLCNENHLEVKRRALVRDGFHCRICDKRIELELHHIDYKYLGKELENMQWVVIVCGEHHQEIHNNVLHEWNPKNKNRKPI